MSSEDENGKYDKYEGILVKKFLKKDVGEQKESKKKQKQKKREVNWLNWFSNCWNKFFDFFF